MPSMRHWRRGDLGCAAMPAVTPVRRRTPWREDALADYAPVRAALGISCRKRRPGRVHAIQRAIALARVAGHRLGGQQRGRLDVALRRRASDHAEAKSWMALRLARRMSPAESR